MVVHGVCSIRVGPNMVHSAGGGGAYIPRWRGEARQQLIHVHVGPNIAHLSVGGHGGGGSKELAHLAGSPLAVSFYLYFRQHGGRAYIPHWWGEAWW